MFEILLQTLPETALTCRALYDASSGGYHLPLREHNRPMHRGEVETLRQQYPRPLYDCVEVPVADLLYTLVLNTRSLHILETGTSRGFSTCHLAAGACAVDAAAARLISVDPAPAPHLFFEESPLAASITAVRADALALDPAALAGGRAFDFMFFDSLHTYAHLSAELTRYLPLLRLGGLFALHDTFVFDALGLVVLALARSGRVEMLSMPSHRRHAEPARSPGVSLFRKIAPVEAGESWFPELGVAADGERHVLPDPAAVVQRSGSLFMDRRYVAHRMHRDARQVLSPALLDVAPQSDGTH